MKNIVGQANEAVSIINGCRCKCLIDTGSQVTTLSKSFYDRYLQNVPLCSLDNLIKVEGANGLPVPYLGYVEVSIRLPGSLPSSQEVAAPVLVVPDTLYNKKVPFCVGTNVIQACIDIGQSDFGDDFVVHRNLNSIWKAVYACMQTPVVSNIEGRIGFARNASKRAVRIPPGEAVIIDCYVPLPRSTCDYEVMLEPQPTFQDGIVVSLATEVRGCVFMSSTGTSVS